MLNPQKQERIANLFASGHSLDFVSEQGALNGWTREQAKEVVAERGWALDWKGVLQSRYLARVQNVPLPTTRALDLDLDDLEEMLSTGLDHEVRAIKSLAIKAQRALAELQRALTIQESKDAEEVASRRRAEQERAAEQANPKNWSHGSWGAYIKHQKHGVPLCGPCEAAGEAYRVAQALSRQGDDSILLEGVSG